MPSNVVSTPILDYSGSITTGGTPQLVLPRWASRSYFFFQNTSTNPLVLEFGSARGLAVVSSGTISSVSVTNGGMGYTFAPKVTLIGGGPSGQVPDGLNAGYVSPTPGGYDTAMGVQAIVTAAVSGGSLTFSVTYPGSGYIGAPYVFLTPDPRDPLGAAKPSATVGIAVAAGATFVQETAYVSPDQVTVYGGTTAQTFVCKVAP